MEDFKKSYAKAKPYEEMFAKLFNQTDMPGDITWLKDKFEADYEINIKGKTHKAEIKIDFTKHKNFFIERYSNIENNRDGGPWQSLNYNAKYYIYWYVNPKNKHQWECYVFNTASLIKWMEANQHNYPYALVKNTENASGEVYSTKGRVVPIEVLASQPFCRKNKIIGTYLGE